jgi:hypothetical protein
VKKLFFRRRRTSKLKKVVVLNETEDLDVSSSRFKLNDEAPFELRPKGSTKCSSRNAKKTRTTAGPLRENEGPCVNDARNTGRKEPSGFRRDEINYSNWLSQQELKSRWAVLENTAKGTDKRKASPA